MRLGGEDEVVQVQDELRRIGEHQKEVLERFGQYERVHAVLVLAGAQIVDGRKAAWHASVFLECLQCLFGHLQVVVVAGSLVQEVGGLDEFGAQMVLAPVDLCPQKRNISSMLVNQLYKIYLKVKRKCLRNERVHLHHLVQHLVRLHGRLQIA